jgi:hypothetical protein
VNDKQHDIDAEFRNIVFGDGLPPAKPMCECNCNSGPYRHADRLCGRHAVVHVALHRWADCDKPADWDGPAAQVDVDGNICAVMCARCANFAVQAAKQSIRKLAGAFPSGVIPHCPSCGRPTIEAADICKVTTL